MYQSANKKRYKLIEISKKALKNVAIDNYTELSEEMYNKFIKEIDTLYK